MAKLTHRIKTDVLVPAWVVERFGEEAATELALSVVIATVSDNSRFCAGWAADDERGGPVFDAESNGYAVPMYASVVAHPGGGLAATIDPYSNLLDDIDILDEMEDAEIKTLLAELSCCNTRVVTIPGKAT